MYYSQKVMGLLGQFEKMSIKELNQVKEMVNEVKVHNAKQSIKVGSKVFVVQKTKKTPGVVTKVKVKNALVKMNNTLYNVPLAMLESCIGDSLIRTYFKITKNNPPLQSLLSKGYRGGIDNAPFSCYNTSINNKEKEKNYGLCFTDR